MTGCSDNDAQWPVEIYAMNMQYTACDAYIYITLLLHMRIFVFAICIVTFLQHYVYNKLGESKLVQVYKILCMSMC